MLLKAVADKTTVRLENRELGAIIQSLLTFGEEDDLSIVRQRLDEALNTLLASELDDHFIDEENVDQLDHAEVPTEEREEIRSYLGQARDAAAKDSFLSDKVRQRFLHRISLAENELFKEKVGIEAFFAVAYEGSRLLRKFGEDAKPMAEAIEKARTKTEKHVTGYDAIEMDEKPKQLPKPE